MDAIEVAATQIGVREQGRNRGEEVVKYQKSIGEWAVGKAWCAAFVWWCIREAHGPERPMDDFYLRKSASVLRFSQFNKKYIRERPGRGIFMIQKSRFLGHMGFVAHVEGNWLMTIEGNTNQAGHRSGDGVYARVRHVDEINLGYMPL